MTWVLLVPAWNMYVQRTSSCLVNLKYKEQSVHFLTLSSCVCHPNGPQPPIIPSKYATFQLLPLAFAFTFGLINRSWWLWFSFHFDHSMYITIYINKMTRGLHNVPRLSPHECFLYMISWAAHTTILFHTYKTSTKGLFGTQKYKTEEWNRGVVIKQKNGKTQEK